MSPTKQWRPEIRAHWRRREPIRLTGALCSEAVANHFANAFHRPVIVDLSDHNIEVVDPS